MQHNDRRETPVLTRGSLVRELREEMGFHTQEQLAVAVGCSRSTVGMWETCRVVPSPRHLSRLAAVLGVTPDQLLHRPGGITLRGLRLSAGLRQEDASRALHLWGKGSYSDVERGRQAIPRRWIPILAELFGVSESTVRESAALPPSGP
ncbi:helix-turn-helix domain-containing protein [Streptomyces flavochromogenes]|uniref:Helix-turn-helix domain-containing protein n=1 Tax=Streptomyces flavochromogenes TaxID=68199 RepID=A0ABW6Y329_9ACTN